MKIRTKLQLSTGAALIVGLFVISAVLFANNQVSREVGESIVYVNLVQSVFALDKVLDDYLAYPDSLRVQRQWKKVYGSLGDLLKGMETKKDSSLSIAPLLESYERLDPLIKQLAAIQINKNEAFRSLEQREILADQLSVNLTSIVSDASKGIRLNQGIIIGTQQRASDITTILMIAFTVAIGMIFVPLIRKLTRSVLELNEGSKIIGGGNLSHRIIIGSSDEVGELGQAFNEMASRLSGSYAALETEVTERKRAEEELRKLNEALEQRVAERTARLEEANAQLHAEIEERRRAEEALRQSRMDLDRAQEVGQIGSWRLNVRRNVLTWSDENYRIFGVPKGTPLTYETFQEIVHPVDRRYVDSRWQAGLRGEPYDIEHRIVVGQQVKWVREKAYLEFDGTGELLGSFGIAQDITERKRMEEELRQSRDELELRVQERTRELMRANEVLREQADLLDLAHDAIIVRDLHDKVLYWNRGAEKTYGWRRDEARGQITHHLLQTKFPQSSAEIGAHLLEEGAWEGELNHIRCDGARIIVESRWALQRNLDGDPSGVLEISRDITESRNMEKQLNRADRLSSMGVLAGGIAHEIRNPLHAMSLFLDVLTDEEKFSRTSQELDVFHEIKSNIKRIDGIIRRVLDFSRQSANSSQKIQAGVLIEQSLELWKSKMTQSGIKLGLSVEENLPEVVGDPIEIQQVLTNLVQNAVEAMKQNGVLGIVAESGTLSFDEKRPAVIVKVQDSGPGIPLDQQKNIFTPFFTTKYTGTGLGLALSHRIISRHGGLISFESTPDEGTTFTVEVPVAPER